MVWLHAWPHQVMCLQRWCPRVAFAIGMGPAVSAVAVAFAFALKILFFYKSLFFSRRQLRTQASRQATVTHARTGGQFYKHAPKWAFLGGLGAYFGFGEDGEVLSTDDNHNMKVNNP